MEAKFYFGVLSALLLAGYPLKAQVSDNRNFRNDDAGLVVNNYYDNYDYYFTSRINRFHRSYSAFDYYSPMFTDLYWYDDQPYTCGSSIYGRNGSGFGFSFNYPVYYYGWGYNNQYNYDYSWYDPYHRNNGNFGHNNSNIDNNGDHNSRQNDNNGNFSNTNNNSNVFRHGNIITSTAKPQAETRSSMPSVQRSLSPSNRRSERTFSSHSGSSSFSGPVPQTSSSSSGRSGSPVLKSITSGSKSSDKSSSKNRGRR
jgi:hypothetical protein